MYLFLRTKASQKLKFKPAQRDRKLSNRTSTAVLVVIWGGGVDFLPNFTVNFAILRLSFAFRLGRKKIRSSASNASFLPFPSFARLLLLELLSIAFAPGFEEVKCARRMLLFAGGILCVPKLEQGDRY